MSSSLYQHCESEQDFLETVNRINLWMLADLDPEALIEYIRRKQ